jgi:hypothetical protein
MSCPIHSCAGGVCVCGGPQKIRQYIQVNAVFLPGASASSACTGQLGDNVPCPTCDCTPGTAPLGSYNPNGKDFNGPGIFCLATPKT